MSDKKNQLFKIYEFGNKLPEGLRSFFFSKVFGRVVPFVGTSKLKYEKFSPNEVVVSIKNKRPFRNHIGQVHAVCMTLVAETATGFILGLNMPDDRINLVKTTQTTYRKPSKGDVKATATLSDEQIQFIKDTPKGELLIPCTITDENNEPATVEMVWAWIPKAELAARRKAKQEAKNQA